MVDPEVTQQKFNRQVADLLTSRDALRQDRGWLIEEVSFPNLYVLFSVPFLRGTIVPFGIELNFEDYNLFPPSARFVEPRSRRPLKLGELLPAQQMVNGQVRNLLLGPHPRTKQPFFCMRGFREYHDHPQHTDDPWERYRYADGVGTAFYCLDQIWLHCVRGVQFNCGLVVGRPVEAVPVGAV